MIFDSHCHPQFPQYDKDREEVFKRTLEQGVFMICVGTDLETSKQGIELAQAYENIWAAVGIHPNDSEVLNITNNVLREFENLLNNKKVVAVGEVGVDYYRTTDINKQEKQREIFGKFIELACKHKKPLIIHVRDAGKGSTGKIHLDMVSILKQYNFYHDREMDYIPRTGVMHSFTGSTDDAKKYLDLGFYLGFNGIITFARQYDEVIKYTPLENILLETDAPYLTPEPYRGQRNEPTYVIEVAKKIAELKNEPLEKVIEITTKNCQNLFNI